MSACAAPSDRHTPAPSESPLDVLAAELGAVAGRIERETTLRIDAAIADLRRIDAERELRLTKLERQVADRLATVRDGRDGENGADGKDADPEAIFAMVTEAVRAIPVPKDGRSIEVADVVPIVAAEVGRAVAALPPAKDGESVDPEAVRQMVADAVGALPKPRDGRDADPQAIRQMVDAAVASLPPPTDGKDADPELISRMVADAVAKIPAPQNGKDADPAVIRSMVDEAVAKLPPPKDGEPGRDGLDGKLPVVRAWTDGVHYQGDCVAHDGSTWQALRDTGRAPPHEDWICIAAAGRPGADGRSFRVRELFSAEVKDYRALDVVALGGAAFVARKDDPGPCPGAGWQLIASQGKSGKPGEPGPRGERGNPGPGAVAIDIDDQGLLTLTNADGSTVACDLYPLLSRLG